MFNFLRKKSKGYGSSGIIALDIGTQNISAILFEIIPEQIEEGRMLSKRHIDIKGMAQINQQEKARHPQQLNDLGNIISNCQKVIREAAKQSKLPATQLVIGISGDFIKGKTVTISEKREDPKVKISYSELSNLLQKMEWKAFTETRKSVSEETGHAEVDVKLINSYITSIKIDGQTVDDPNGFQGKTVECSLFNAFTPNNYYDALQSIAHELDLELLEIIAEPFALWQCATSQKEEESMILIDIGCHMTSIAVVEKNALIDTKSFSLGGESLTKRLALELNISVSEAEKLKKAYSDDKLEAKSKSLVRELIEHDIELWLEAISLSLSEIKTSNGLPVKIYLSGGGSQLAEIKNTMNNSKWYKDLAFPRKPQTNQIDWQAIENIGGNKKGIEKSIMAVGLAKAAMEITDSDNKLQQTLKKVIGIMKV